MLPSNLQQFSSLYNETAQEYFDSLKKDIKLLFAHPHDRVIIADLRISAHSLKSQSHMMGYLSTSHLCRAMEYVFTGMLHKQITLNAELQKSLVLGLSALEKSLHHIKQSGKELPSAHATTALNHFLHAKKL